MIIEEELDNFKVRYSFASEAITKGYILVEETIDVVNIIDVFTKEEYRKKGVSSRILKYIINKYKGNKAKLMLEVRSKNIPAINLYKKFDFKEIYVRENYYKDDDALIMEMML